MSLVPFAKSWWVVPGELLAGGYPGAMDPVVARKKLAALVAAGIRTVVCLQEPDERSRAGQPFAPYGGMLAEVAREQRADVNVRRFPIRDVDTPTPQLMQDILDAIDAALRDGRAVYIHCWGGHGRTATVVGCWLVSKGMTGEDALSRITELRHEHPELRHEPAPQTEKQRAMVRNWPRRQEQETEPSRLPQDVSRSASVDLADRYQGGLLGLAAGDALGTTLEFTSPGTFDPITDMVGGGPFRLEPGQWTDDTSLALCLAESLVAQGGFDPEDQITRYCRWWREGHLSSTGTCFDIGGTTGAALATFERTGDPWAGSTNPSRAGNGSLMRLVPVPLAFARHPEQAVLMAGESSRTTHGARECVDACRYFAALVVGAVCGTAKEELLGARYSPVPGYWGEHPLSPKIDAVATGSFKEKRPPEIRGTGYVVDCLEAALWAFHNSTAFKDGALLAVNLGDDADTTGAVYGQLAGVFYGARGIPAAWTERLAKCDLLVDLAERLLAMAESPGDVGKPHGSW